MWGLDRFTEYLIKIGKINSVEWLDSYLRPAFSKAFIHLARAARDRMVKDSRFF